MKKLIVTAVLAIASVGALASSASASVWYWSPSRAASALERYQPRVAVDGSGAYCTGVGSSIFGDTGKRLYHTLYCNVYTSSGSSLGTGKLTVIGSSLSRFRFSYRTTSVPTSGVSYPYNDGGGATLYADGTVVDKYGNTHSGGYVGKEDGLIRW